MSQYQLIKEAQAEANQAFGQMLRRWREINGWTQYTPEKWAFEAGFIALRHSNVSQLENAKGTPRFKTYLCLAEINRRLGLKDLSGVRSRDLKDLLTASEPLVDGDGLLWGPAQFWECQHGLRAVPEKYQVVTHALPTLSNERANAMSRDWRSRVLSAARVAGLKPIEMLSRAAKVPPVGQRDHFQSVLTGLVEYTPAELNALWDGTQATWLPEIWVKSWVESLDQDPSPLGGGGGTS